LTDSNWRLNDLIEKVRDLSPEEKKNFDFFLYEVFEMARGVHEGRYIKNENDFRNRIS
jgi:hypothetical protein